ncbi:AraC family transcriptional regulator [Lutispora sp.]|nr:AraC family transcriptional regulator [Lutispora sp.]MEA4960865.1 AraC family transcriptional regulator [Lutispora sp.]
MSVDLHGVIDLTGAIPFDNIEDAKVVIENFCCNNIAVIVTNKVTNIAHGTHHHDSYEFVIPYAKLPSAVIDDKVYDRRSNSLFAVNPMQEHGVSINIKGFTLCGIHIGKSLIQEISEEMYGSGNIVFSNDSNVLNHDISMLIRLFLEELRFKQTGYEFMTNNLSLLIAGNLIRQLRHNLPPRPHNVPKGTKENIKKAIDYMNENYASGVSCTELAQLIKMDQYSFIRSFKAQTSKTPYEYLIDLKIEKAKKMLQSCKYSITEISLMCGFSSHSHFTSTFKKKTGISPTEYRINP